MEETIFKSGSKLPESKVPMTRALEALLNPHLHDKEPIFTKPLVPPAEGEKVYSLSTEDVNKIRQMRGAVIDLHPGMGGIAPDQIISMIKSGAKLSSLDYMITRGCNFECTWCFAGSGPAQKEDISLAKLQSVTEEAADLGVSLFILTGGEPLVYRDPRLGRMGARGGHFFKAVEMIRDVYSRKC